MKHRIIAAAAALLILTGCAGNDGVKPTTQPAPADGTISVNRVAAAPPSTETVIIISVYDADTYTLEDGRKVRILGIDAPELKATPGDTTAEAEAEKCYGTQARDYARTLLAGEQVTITGDPEQGDRDRYNRLLRYVTLPDGTDVGTRLLTEGMARVYRAYPVAKTSTYQTVQDQAAAAKTGGWGACGWTQ